MGFAKKGKGTPPHCPPPGRISASALRDREVVSVSDGRRLGYVCDMEIDISTGRICSLTVPGELKFFGFARKNTWIIPWDAIVRIGNDIILVNTACVEQRGGDGDL